MADPSTQRRHDLDALRAFAMLLGIGLHAALSFAPFPWPVQDRQQSDLFSLFFVAVHGFRMPLFFLVSGFFTALLWRQKGLQALLQHRFQRVFIPCLLGLLTVIPAMHWVTNWALASPRRAPTVVDQTQPPTDVFSAIKRSDTTSLERFLADGTDLKARDSEFGVTMLSWTAMLGDEAATRLLIEKGADVNGRNQDGSTPLHSAAFLGHPAIVQLLLDKGADATAQYDRGHRPLDATKADWGTTQFLAGLLRISLRSEEEVRAGRDECRERLPISTDQNTAGTQPDDSAVVARLQQVRSAYAATLNSDRWQIRWSATSPALHLIHSDVFDHLWFLWFLCWLIPLFAAVVWTADRCGMKAVPRWLVVSPVRFCWLLPLTMVPQLMMGTLTPSFGPDTSVGLIPQPHLLLYYGIFFAFGALYFECDDAEGRLGRWWWLTIPMAIIVVLPAGLATMPVPVVSSAVQVCYAWLMTFGTMGLFRRLLTREYPTIRYLSDSSYWLYVAHLPLVIGGQNIIRDWPIPAGLKFALLCTAVTTLLLVSYQTLVRYTWLGALLNGRRQRTHATASSISEGEGHHDASQR